MNSDDWVSWALGSSGIGKTGIWVNRDGEEMLIKNMETGHIINCIAHIWKTEAKRWRMAGPQRKPAYDPKTKIQEFLTELKRRDET